MNKDLKQIKLLEIFHYIWCGLASLVGIMGVGYTVVGVSLMQKSEGAGTLPVDPGWAFVGVGIVTLVIGEFCSISSLIAARFYRKHRGYGWCFFTAIVSLLAGPIGLALGIFSLLVLNRNSVKELFRSGAKPVAAISV